ncbi:hypothetical protein N825_00640 [Skermanella stibiiresistens SB22]|uniref:Uncharacterized protein n=2 Tax=Skermanella TaxID=204447 RepID=W9HDJ7_9PROT|nr:hypothetical protein N825_00640 [Skermanella stibiiresistens SB22]
MWVLSFQQEDARASVTATAAAVPAALAAILWSIRQHQKTTRQQERQRALDYATTQSGFYLENWRDGVGNAYSLLADGNKNRVTWISAARILVRCKQIESGITEPHHQAILERLKDEYRRPFSMVLGYENPGVTASFFYGAPADLPTDTAAILSIPDSFRRLALAEASVQIVWEFAHYPEDYQDLIRDTEFTPRHKGRMWYSYPDLCEWLIHIDKYRSDGRMLHTLPEERRPISNLYPEAPEMAAKRSNRMRYRIAQKRLESRRFRIQPRLLTGCGDL